MDNVDTKIIKERRPPLIARLRAAQKAWEEYVKPLLVCRNRMLRHYADSYFAGSGLGVGEQPLNLIDRAVGILGPFLVSQNPKALVKADKGNTNPNARMFAKTLELMLNDVCEEIKLAQYTLRPAAIDSLFGMGITATGVMQSHSVEVGGYLHDYGQPYCDKIDMADYIADRNARNRQEMHFEGYKYRLPLQFVAESGLFKNYDRLKPNLRLYGQGIHPDEISKGMKINKSDLEIYPTVELMNMWLPDSDMIVTIAPEGQGDKYLREVEWDGPETGPIDVLALKYFPDSILPIPPAYTWMEVHKIINIIVKKMRDMVEREKTVAVGDLGNAEDAEIIKNAGHGDIVLLKGGGAETVKEVTFGGFNPQSFPFLQFLLMEFSRLGPNLSLTGGREALSGTLGQEQMLQNNALREIDDMVNQIYEFTRSVMLKLAHFVIIDPLKTKRFPQELMGIPYELEYHSSRAEGILRDYRIDIEPYSLSRMNPEMRYQRVLQLLSQIVIPLAPLAAQQGSYPSVDAIVRELGDYLHVDTQNWWISAMPSMGQLGQNQPNAGTNLPKSGQTNVGEMGQMEASKLTNLQQATSGGGA